MVKKWTEAGGGVHPGQQQFGLTSASSSAVRSSGIEVKVASVYAQPVSPNGKHRQAVWCEAHHVSRQALQMAHVNSQRIWTDLQQSGMVMDVSGEVTCQPEDINRMFAAGFFQNFASQYRREYLHAEGQHRAVVKPGLSYQALHTEKWARWVAYREWFVHNTEVQFWVVPVKLEWLNDLSPVYFEDRAQELQVRQALHLQSMRSCLSSVLARELTVLSLVASARPALLQPLRHVER